MVDAADQIRAPGGLGILDSEAGDPRAVFQVQQKGGDIGGPQVYREAKAAAACRGEADQLGAATMHPECPFSLDGGFAQRGGKPLRRTEVDGVRWCAQGARNAVGIGDIVGQGGDRQAQVAAANGRIQRQHLALVSCGRIRTHHRGERARRHFHRAVAAHPQLAGAQPFLPAVTGVVAGDCNRAGLQQVGRARVDVVDVAFHHAHHAGTAGAASAAGADKAQAIAARALENGLFSAHRDLAIELGKAQCVRRWSGCAGHVRFSEQ